MLRNVPTAWLAILALSVTLLDLTVVGPIAIGGDEDEVATPEPVFIPELAFLTGAVAEEGVVDGFEVAVRSDEGRYSLALTNPGDEPRNADIHVSVYETSGMLVGRMGPMRTQVDTQIIQASVQPGETVVQPITWSRVEQQDNLVADVPSPALISLPNDNVGPLNDSVVPFDFFTTVEFSVQPNRTPEQGEVITAAMLRAPVPTTAEAAFEAVVDTAASLVAVEL